MVNRLFASSKSLNWNLLHIELHIPSGREYDNKWIKRWSAQWIEQTNQLSEKQRPGETRSAKESASETTTEKNQLGKYITKRRMSEPNKTAIPMECIVNSTTIYSHLERLCKMHFKIIKGIIEYIKLSDDDNNGRRQHFSNEPNKNSLALSPLCFKNVEHIASWQKNARVLIEGRNKSEWHFMLLYFCITRARRVKELAWYFFSPSFVVFSVVVVVFVPCPYC